MINFEENIELKCHECGCNLTDFSNEKDKEGTVIYCEKCGSPNFIHSLNIEKVMASSHKGHFKSIWNLINPDDDKFNE